MVDRAGTAASGTLRALVDALRPTTAPWLVGPGIRAAVVAGVVLAGALALGEPLAVGIVYFGVACAAVFVGGEDYVIRVAMVAGQACGAVTGMIVGSLVPPAVPYVVVAATVVGLAAGAVGRFGPAATAWGVMAVIGVAYTQFARLPLPWWQPPVYYLLGSALLLVVSVAGALIHPERYRRVALANVFSAAADLVRATAEDVAAARHRLALASAAARRTCADYRLRTTTADQLLTVAYGQAREAAQRAAVVSADESDPGGMAELAFDWEQRADKLRAGAPLPAGPVEESSPDGPLIRARALLGLTLERAALLDGLRLAVCVAVATGLAVLLHPPAEAFWIPLTIAVVVRPEYAPVLVRSVHRLVGTVVGVLCVAALVVLTPGPLGLAVGGAVALGLAVVAGRRIYGLAVVGVTGSALLSITLAAPAAFEPWWRLADTVLGCAIAVLVGVVCWPARGIPDHRVRFAAVAAAVARQVDVEFDQASASVRIASRDASYRRAHEWRAELERGVAEPDPARASERWLPVALLLEATVDRVSAIAVAVGRGERSVSPAERQDLAARLRRLGSGGGPRQAEQGLAEVRQALRALSG